LKELTEGFQKQSYFEELETKEELWYQKVTVEQMNKLIYLVADIARIQLVQT
jgi:hypothetical protein